MRIVLCCAYWMSTSIMMNRMEEYAKSKEMDIAIEAIPAGELENYLAEADVVLLGPQVKCMLGKIKKKLDNKVPYAMIDTGDYGMMRGDKVVEQALRLLKDRGGAI